MNDETTKPLLERDDLEEALTEAGFTQISGGGLPDNLMWSVYQHHFQQSVVPRCLWVITNLEPPVCHLAGNWTDDPDRAFDQVMAYVRTWLCSEASFASLRKRNSTRSAAPETTTAPMATDEGGEPHPLIKNTARVVWDELVKRVVFGGMNQ